MIKNVYFKLENETIYCIARRVAKNLTFRKQARMHVVLTYDK